MDYKEVAAIILILYVIIAAAYIIPKEKTKIATVDGPNLHIRGYYAKVVYIFNDQEKTFAYYYGFKNQPVVKTQYVTVDGEKYPIYRNANFQIPYTAKEFHLDGKTYTITRHNLKPVAYATTVIALIAAGLIAMITRSRKVAYTLVVVSILFLSFFATKTYEVDSNVNYLLTGPHVFGVHITKETVINGSGAHVIYTMDPAMYAQEHAVIDYDRIIADGKEYPITDLTFQDKLPKTFEIGGKKYTLERKTTPFMFHVPPITLLVAAFTITTLLGLIALHDDKGTLALSLLSGLFGATLVIHREMSGIGDNAWFIAAAAAIFMLTLITALAIASEGYTGEDPSTTPQNEQT